MNWKHIFVSLLMLLLASPAWPSEDLSHYAVPKGFLPKVGEQLPAFALKDIRGRPLSLKDLHGKVTVIAFYTTYCSPCHRDIPALNQFAKSTPKVRVLAITCDNAKETATFLKGSGLKWPVLIDAQPYFDKIGVEAFPSFVLVGATGILLDATYGNRLSDGDGYASAAGLAKWVSSLTK